MSKYSRLQYNGINVDFDRGLSAFSPIPQQVKNVAVSRAGIAETRNFYRYWSFAFARAHAHGDLKNQIAAFWDYVRTGASFAFWHDRDLMSYWNFEGKSLKNINEVNATFTRATTAYYDDPSTGLLTSVASGAARFPAGKFGRGVLVERAATNLLTHSEELGDASWTATNITVTTNTAQTKAPDGTATAETLLCTSTDGTLRKDTSTNIGTDDGVFSIYLKNDTTGTVTINLYIIRADTGATLVFKACSVTGEWVRYSAVYESAGSITANWGVVIEMPTGGSRVYADCAQLEVGVDVLTASSYIKTVAAAATRNIDTIAYGASNFFDYYPVRGTISFWFAPTWPTSSNNLTRYFFTLEGLNVDSVLYLDASELLKFSIGVNDGTSIVATSSAVSLTANTFVHIAVTWDSTIVNGLKIYFNGVLVGSSSNSFFSLTPRDTNFYIGSDSANVSCDGIIDDFMIRRDVLDASEIADIARGLRPLGYDRNYWSALMIEERQYTQNRLPGVPLWDIEIPVREVIS